MDDGAFLRLLTDLRAPSVILAAAVALASCGGGTGAPPGADLPKCTGALPAARAVEGVPEDFPAPDDALYVESDRAGPSVIVHGFYDGEIGVSFDAWRAAFEDAGWTITKDERETLDAEVFFARGEVNGQVNMFAECAGRTKLTITIRPS